MSTASMMPTAAASKALTAVANVPSAGSCSSITPMQNALITMPCGIFKSLQTYITAMMPTPQSPALCGDRRKRMAPHKSPSTVPAKRSIAPRRESSMLRSMLKTAATTATSGCSKWARSHKSSDTVAARPVLKMRSPSRAPFFCAFIGCRAAQSAARPAAPRRSRGRGRPRARPGRGSPTRPRRCPCRRQPPSACPCSCRRCKGSRRA